MPPRVVLDEIYIERKKLVEMAGFTQGDLPSFLSRHGIEPNEDNLYPVTKIMCCLNEERKKRGKVTKAEGIGEYELAKKREEVRKLKIMNDEREKLLIRRADVRDRVRIAFQAVASKVRYSVKLAAPKLVGIEQVRTIEEILTKSYNNAIKYLEDESENVTWAQDGLADETEDIERGNLVAFDS